MIQILQPSSLLSKQKVFQISRGVEKNKEIEPPAKKFKVVVLYAHPEAELPFATSEMLGKLIRACKFSEDETLLFNQAPNATSIGFFQSRYEPELILIFGDIHLSKNISKLRKNSPYEINGTQIIQTESLENLEKIKGAKGILWETLKKTLNIE